MKRRRRAIILLTLTLFASVPVAAIAGPPFQTDDPEPVPYRHWEIYIVETYAHAGTGISGSLPIVEVNYGVVPNVQLSIVAPVSYVQSAGNGFRAGYGDTEIGIKLRFIQETRARPQVAVYPIAILPTRNARSGLGEGTVRTLLPLWLQKSWGAWTTYAGVGRWHNPGVGNRDWWYTGWTVEHENASGVVVGSEVFHATSDRVDRAGATGFAVGLIAPIRGRTNLLLSVGRSLRGDNSVSVYGAYEIKFGPEPDTRLRAEQTPKHNGTLRPS